MAELEGLIKYRKHLADEKQRILAQLFREAEKFETYKTELLTQVEKEKALVENDPNISTQEYLGLYLQGARQKVAQIDTVLAALDERIKRAQDEVRRAFSEQKKAEIVDRKRKAAIKKEQDKKDSDALDDIAIERHIRAEEEG